MAIPENKKNNTSQDVITPVPRYLFTLIPLLALLILGTIGYSFYTVFQTRNVFLPSVDATMELKYEITAARLWLEKILSGDTINNNEVVWKHLNKADWHAQALLHGDRSPHVSVVPIPDKKLMAKFSHIQRYLLDIRRIAKERIELKEKGAACTEIDQQFDSLFVHLQNDCEETEQYLKTIISQKTTLYNILQLVLTVAAIIIALVVGLVIYRFSKIRVRDMHELQAANQQLDAANQQLTASEQHLKAANQQLQANEKQLKASNQQLIASEQQLQSANHQLKANGQQLQAANKQIKELFERNKSILGAITDIIMEVDANKVYTWANKAGYYFFGEDVIGKEATDYFEGEQKTYEIVNPLFQGDENVIYVESWQRRRDGEKRLLAWWCRVLKDADGNIKGAISSARDITEQRVLEDQISQTQKMEAIGQLAGGIAHDFNNQLTGIMGYADLLRENLVHNKDLFRYADMIITATRRSADLTDQLLAFARKGKYLEIPINMHKVISEVVSLLEHSIDKKVQIKQNLYANPPITSGDPTQMQNALLNLAINARDAMPDGGEMIFSTDVIFLDEEYCSANPYEIVPGSYLQVSITDTGTGMDEETQRHIFEPFFTTKETGKGTGMGLAAVYGTVKNHKGAINVYSELEFGTTFKIYLPLLDSSSDMDGEAKDREKIIKGNARILVVDDEEMILDLVSDMLESMDYTVVACANGKEAVTRYKKSWKKVDLVILDMVMPEMGGHEAFIAMKKINPDIKALLSSGYSINGEAEKILEEGVLDFIQKPYQKAELSQKVAHALGIAV